MALNKKYGKKNFQTGYFYHIYNRGTDKRRIFEVKQDFVRFITCIREFNNIKPIGSLFLKKYIDKKRTFEKSDSSEFEESDFSNSLVEIICYSLLPNHFHLLLRQKADNGISKFMQRLGTGHTNYFNMKYNRSGGLFQGRYKSVAIKSDEQLWYLSSYINGNSEIYNIASADTHEWCSYPDYLGKRNGTLCNKECILKEFKDTRDYKNYTNEVIKNSKQIKEEIKKYLLEV